MREMSGLDDDVIGSQHSEPLPDLLIRALLTPILLRKKPRQRVRVISLETTSLVIDQVALQHAMDTVIFRPPQSRFAQVIFRRDRSGHGYRMLEAAYPDDWGSAPTTAHPPREIVHHRLLPVQEPRKHMA